jgi:chorismate mutase
MKKLDELRERIDGIDDGIVELLEKRVAFARKIGLLKQNAGLDVYDEEREKEVLRKVKSKTSLNKKFIENVFKLIIEYCRENE